MVEELIEALAKAIARQEGFGKPGRATKNNNPGNIINPVVDKKTGKRMFNLPADDKGFCVYPDVATGWEGLKFQIRVKINRYHSLTQLIHAWAPPVENDTGTYLKNVSKWLGITDTGSPLLDVAKTWTPPDTVK